MKLNLGIDLSRVVVVEATEGKTVIEEEAPVCHVQRIDGKCCAFAESLSDGEVKCCMLRQVRAGIGRRRIGESIRET
jgi:hypothetical protein